MKPRRSMDFTACTSLRNFGLACMSAGTIVGLAGVPCKFAIAKPEFDPKDTRASGEPPPPTGQPLLKNLTYEQEPNNATNN
jgi:hypothetical protein